MLNKMVDLNYIPYCITVYSILGMRNSFHSIYSPRNSYMLHFGTSSCMELVGISRRSFLISFHVWPLFYSGKPTLACV